jgi:hypothetical protein
MAWLAATHVYAVTLWVRTGVLLPALEGRVLNAPVKPAADQSDRAWPTVFRDPSGGDSRSTRFGMTSVEPLQVLVVIVTFGSPLPYLALVADAFAWKRWSRVSLNVCGKMQVKLSPGEPPAAMLVGIGQLDGREMAWLFLVTTSPKSLAVPPSLTTLTLSHPVGFRSVTSFELSVVRARVRSPVP